MEEIANVRRALHLALRYINKATTLDTKLSNANLLTTKDATKIEAYKAFENYLRCGVSDPPVVKLFGVFGGSLATATTTTTYYSLMDLVGDGCWSSGRKNVDQELIDVAFDVSASFKEGVGPGSFVWLTLIRKSLYDPLFYFARHILKKVQIERWKASDGFAEGLKELGKIVYYTVSYDAWLRDRAKPEDVADWHYHRDVHERSNQHEKLELSKSAIRDDYASYALLICPFLENPQKVDVGEGLHMWEVRIDFESLERYAEKIKRHMEEHKEVIFHFEEIIPEIVSGRMKGVASPLRRVAGLWRGWVGSMLKGIAEVSEEGKPFQVVYLRIWEPPFRHYPFDGDEFMRLTANTLAISRQLAHIYSYMAKLFVEKAKRAGLGEIAEKIKERLDPLYSKSPGLASDELRRIPARPFPSIYEQIFHTPTVMVGMAYNVLSGISLALELDPEIPPDPLDLINLDPVKEECGKYWSDLTRPELSESVELLRTSAQIPVGILEWYFDYIRMTLELYPVPDALLGW
jgi:hypothetical protein